jgi:hypothetical protein
VLELLGLGLGLRATVGVRVRVRVRVGLGMGRVVYQLPLRPPTVIAMVRVRDYDSVHNATFLQS